MRYRSFSALTPAPEAGGRQFESAHIHQVVPRSYGFTLHLPSALFCCKFGTIGTTEAPVPDAGLGTKEICRQESPAHVVGKHCTFRQDLSSARCTGPNFRFARHPPRIESVDPSDHSNLPVPDVRSGFPIHVRLTSEEKKMCFYSSRRTCMGSTREARRDGRREAAVATMRTRRMTAKSVGKSLGETP